MSFNQTYLYDGQSWFAGPELPIDGYHCNAHPINDAEDKVMIGIGWTRGDPGKSSMKKKIQSRISGKYSKSRYFKVDGHDWSDLRTVWKTEKTKPNIWQIFNVHIPWGWWSWLYLELLKVGQVLDFKQTVKYFMFKAPLLLTSWRCWGCVTVPMIWDAITGAVLNFLMYQL